MPAAGAPATVRAQKQAGRSPPGCSKLEKPRPAVLSRSALAQSVLITKAAPASLLAERGFGSAVEAKRPNGMRSPVRVQLGTEQWGRGTNVGGAEQLGSVRHVDEAGVVALEGDGDGGGGAVAVLGDDEVGLTLTR